LNPGACRSTAIILSPAPALQPAPLFTPTPKATRRVLEFYTAQVNNDHTRKAHLNATRRFAEWWICFAAPGDTTTSFACASGTQYPGIGSWQYDPS
jgi:hypothetical protein